MPQLRGNGPILWLNIYSLHRVLLPEFDKEGKIILEPQAITDTRVCQLRNRSISKYLIKWKKLPTKGSTW